MKCQLGEETVAAVVSSRASVRPWGDGGSYRDSACRPIPLRAADSQLCQSTA